MNPELLARLARLGPVQASLYPPLAPEDAETVELRLAGRFDQRITVARRLCEAGANLRTAHTAITEL
ncbi:MAG TPA: hypothetical protein VGC80_08665, partial [Acetobacteraceae bacterium]